MPMRATKPRNRGLRRKEGRASSASPTKSSGYRMMPVKLPLRTLSTHQYKVVVRMKPARPTTSSQRGAWGYSSAPSIARLLAR
jgi:hypothetical protein